MEIKFSVATKQKGILTKILSLKNSEIIKDGSQCRMSTGIITTHTIDSFERFRKALILLDNKHNKALIHGIPKENFEKQTLKLISKARYTGKEKETITRTKEHIVYPDGAGVMLLDHDKARIESVSLHDKALQTLKPDALISVLSEIHSDLKQAAYVSSVSTSACIYNREEKQLRGEGSGTHIYVFPEKAIDIPRYLKTLGERLILAGYGRVEISRSGALNIRTIIDLTVGSPERLDFVAGAVCKNGLKQKRPAPVLRDGALLYTLSLPNLTEEEEEQYNKTITELKKTAAPEADKVKQVYIKYEIKKLIKKRPNLTKEKAETIIIDRQNHLLQNDDLLYFSKDNGVGKTVREILEQHDLYDKQGLADPLEPEYDGNNLTKAIFYYNKGKGDPCIHSYAHGSVKYTFAAFQEALNGAPKCLKAPLKNSKKQLVKKGKKARRKKETNKTNKTNTGKYPPETLIRLNELNQKFAACLLGDKFRVIKKKKDRILNCTAHSFIQLSSFQNYFMNEQKPINTETGQKFYPVAKLWMEWPERKTYSDVVFYPGNKTAKFNNSYNLFQGFPVTPQKGTWKHLKEHMFNIICAGDSGHMEYLLDWMARCVQDPAGERPGVAVVMRGGKGCGKGIFANYFGRIFGEAYMPISSAKGFVGRFNWHLAKSLCVFLDEAIWSGDKQHEGQLKALITEPVMLYEAKGVEPIQLRNYINVLIASNEDWVCPATIDERRFFVLEPLPDKTKDRAYFDAICDERDNGGVEALYYDLMHREYDIGRLRLAPKTEGLKKQVEQSLDLITGFWVFVLERGFLLSDPISGEPRPALEGDDTNIWPDYTYKYEVYNEFMNVFCRKERFIPNNIHFWRKTWLIMRLRDCKKNGKRAFKAESLYSIYAEMKERTGIIIESLEEDWQEQDLFLNKENNFLNKENNKKNEPDGLNIEEEEEEIPF